MSTILDTIAAHARLRVAKDRERVSGETIRALAAESGTGRGSVFSGADEAGWAYANGQEGCDLRATAQTLNEALRGRGGGKPNFIQGRVWASRAEIEEYFGK